MDIRYFKLFTCLLFLSFQAVGQENPYEVWIKGARVIDGTGNPSYPAHVLIGAGEILRIEKDTTVHFEADLEMDAMGKVLSPGFIDTHAHGDPLKDPEFQNFLAMGVTSICLGQDGYSPKEDLRGWMQKVSRKRPGVNIALFAGHNSLRELSGIGFDSLSGEAGMGRMKRLLRHAFNAGVFGMSTGLEYLPGSMAGAEELLELAEVVGKHQGLVMSHMRNEDDDQIETSLRELIIQGQRARVHVSHLKSVYGKGSDRAGEILAMLESARAEGTTITADIYPYTASYTGIGIVFPSWAKKPHDYHQVVETRRSELQAFLRKKILRRNGPEATLFGSGEFAGKNLLEVSKDLDKPFEDVLIEDIGPYGASGAYFIMDEALQERLIVHELVNICSDGSPQMFHPRGYGSFARIIEHYVGRKAQLSLEEAIYKMTGLPAEILGLPDRGLIREGYKADLLLFDPKRIRAKATYQDPHQLATGFEYVWVNGKLSKRGRDFLKRHGMMLKKR